MWADGRRNQSFKGRRIQCCSSSPRSSMLRSFLSNRGPALNRRFGSFRGGHPWKEVIFKWILEGRQARCNKGPVCRVHTWRDFHFHSSVSWGSARGSTLAQRRGKDFAAPVAHFAIWLVRSCEGSQAKTLESAFLISLAQWTGYVRRFDEPKYSVTGPVAVFGTE